MATREFPALGFDPAPGDTAAVSAAASDVRGAGTVFSDASANVSKLNSSAWTGDGPTPSAASSRTCRGTSTWRPARTRLPRRRSSTGATA